MGLEVRNVAGVRVRRLAFLGETHVGSDYLDVIAPRGLEETVAFAFAEALREAMDDYDVLDLTDFREGSPTIDALTATFEGEGQRCLVRPRYTCPFETFAPGETFDDFLKRTVRRDNFLRRRKWLQKQPGFRIDKVERPGELARSMSDFQRLHAARWASDGGSQGIKGPSVEAFHRDATQWLAEQGKVRMYTMRLGETPVASVYGLLHNGEFIYFQSGYDPAWRNKSVGLVLVGETFQDAIGEGLRGYDFLRGTEAYKSDWTHQTRQTVSLRIHAPKGAGAWLTTHERWAASARGVAKALMPTRAVESIRRLRRRRAAI
jgi:CelD/BcsL family acetyltransferase involved in cellulose biosynthesis